MKLSNKAYDILKPVALVWLPALGTLYFALSQIWGLPDGGEVVGSITAVDAFLGAGLGLSSSSYEPPTDGKIVVDDSDPEKTVASLELDTPPEQMTTLKAGSTVIFKVVPKSLPSQGNHVV